MKQTVNDMRRLALMLALAMSNPATSAEPTRARIETSAGNIVVQLEPERAPISVRNFLQYARENYFVDTVFHRVVNGFVIQGGGYDKDLKLKPPRPTIPNESGNGLTNRRGTIAMARTGEPHSADSQFYINLADNFALDPKPTRWGYAVFGEVVEGMDVVDEIGHRATTTRDGMQDLPAEPIVIRKVVLISGMAP
jgi:cyclophilin family peptidyl-prolyl cis-trans isomerase